MAGTEGTEEVCLEVEAITSRTALVAEAITSRAALAAEAIIKEMALAAVRQMLIAAALALAVARGTHLPRQAEEVRLEVSLEARHDRVS